MAEDIEHWEKMTNATTGSDANDDGETNECPVKRKNLFE